MREYPAKFMGLKSFDSEGESNEVSESSIEAHIPTVQVKFRKEKHPLLACKRLVKRK